MVGGGAAPAFRCTNARYDPDDGEMTACDMVIQADQDLGDSVISLLRDFDFSFVLYSGDMPLQIVSPFEVLEAGNGTKSPLPKLPGLARDLDRYLRRMLKAPGRVSVFLHEGSAPVP